MTDLREVSALEAARLLGVNERTIRLWIKGERLQATKVPHQSRLRIPMSEIARIQQERAEQESVTSLPTMRQMTERVEQLAEAQAEQREDQGKELTEWRTRIVRLEQMVS